MPDAEPQPQRAAERVQTKTEVSNPERPRLSLADSEFLRVDDRLVKLEKSSALNTTDIDMLVNILMRQQLTVSVVQLGLIVLAGIYFYNLYQREISNRA